MDEVEARVRCLELTARHMHAPWQFSDVVRVSRMLADFSLTGEAPQVNLRSEASDRKCACSFCGKASDDVAVLIAGPDQFICDECVEIGAAIVAEKRRGRDWPARSQETRGQDG